MSLVAGFSEMVNEGGSKILVSFDLHYFTGRIKDEGAEATLGEAERTMQVLEEDT
jgi:hypothetical protein